MENIKEIGLVIKEKRLQLNMTMDSLAIKTGVTRATLSKIENGSYRCSFANLLSILQVLDIEILIKNNNEQHDKRLRAARTNNTNDKIINEFIIMCIEQYANYINESSTSAYNKMKNSGVIDELTNDYQDLHGMSKEYINEYISSLI